MGGASVGDLPDDIMRHIASKLRNTIWLRQLRLVSKCWRAAATAHVTERLGGRPHLTPRLKVALAFGSMEHLEFDCHLWSGYTRDKFYQTDFRVVANIVQVAFPQLCSLNVYAKEPLLLPAMLAPHCSKLTSLTLTDGKPSSFDWSPIVAQMTLLRHLEFQRVHLDDEHMWRVVKSCTALKEFKSTIYGLDEDCGTFSGAPLQELRQLTSLSLHAPKAKGAPFWDALGSLTQLQHLRLALFEDASSERLSALAALTGLEALSLSRLRGYEDQWADLIRYPRLTSLELCGHANPIATPSQWLQMISGCNKQLQNLNLSGSVLPGDCREVLTEALGQFRELTRLSIANLDIHNRDGRIKSPCMSTGVAMRIGQCLKELRELIFSAASPIELEAFALSRMAGLSKLECINVNELTGDQAAAVVQGIVSTSLTSLRLAHGKLNTGDLNLGVHEATAIEKMRQLRQLELSGSCVPAPVMDSIVSLSQLEHISLNCVWEHACALSRLHMLTRLEVPNLRYSSNEPRFLNRVILPLHKRGLSSMRGEYVQQIEHWAAEEDRKQSAIAKSVRNIVQSVARRSPKPQR
mmetsp:Transcript_1162/g.3489  ORF Transcript_1162/g.3489 Transcript_1162/m.3489 type:complete len:579 (+) Transcript_1162:194-1930(+)